LVYKKKIRYLQYEKRYSPHTTKSYQTDLAQFSEYLKTQYELKPHEATHGAIRSWIVQLSEEKLDAASINRKIACLRSYYKFLLREDILTESPMMKVKILKTKKKLPHFVKEPDMVTLLDHAGFEDTHQGWRQKLILELFYGTGMRLSELISLKEGQINLREQTCLRKDRD